MSLSLTVSLSIFSYELYLLSSSRKFNSFHCCAAACDLPNSEAGNQRHILNAMD